MFLTTAEACARLGVKPATLYAYVSRGLVRSEPAPGHSRERRYHAGDVQALLDRRAGRRDPEAAVAGALEGALDWGGPVLESALTQIADGELRYRGERVTDLAQWATVEEVAALLWTGDPGGWQALPLRLRLNLNLSAHPRAASPQGAPEAFAYALTYAGAHDVGALDPRPQALPAQAARVLSLLYATLERHHSVPPAPDLPLHARLARAWGCAAPGDAGLLRRALVLLADHELNVSAFAARVTASAGASLHHAALSALCALQGPRHGLAVLDAGGLLRHAERVGARPALRDAVRRSGQAPGFGHRLYPAGDVRARALLGALHRAAPGHPALGVVGALTELAAQETGERPNVDLALAALTRVLGRPDEDGVTLFALARASGWLAHAIETVGSGQLIRPRARYVGRRPGPQEERDEAQR